MNMIMLNCWLSENFNSYSLLCPYFERVIYMEVNISQRMNVIVEFLSHFFLQIFGQRVSNQVKDVAQEAILYFIFIFILKEKHTRVPGLDVDMKKIFIWRHGFRPIIFKRNGVVDEMRWVDRSFCMKSLEFCSLDKIYFCSVLLFISLTWEFFFKQGTNRYKKWQGHRTMAKARGALPTLAKIQFCASY